MHPAEQLQKKSKRWSDPGRKAVRWYKKHTSRWRRRLWRKHGEDAPTRSKYSGWVD